MHLLFLKFKHKHEIKVAFAFITKFRSFYFLFFSSLMIFLFYLKGCFGSFVKINLKRSLKEEELR